MPNRREILKAAGLSLGGLGLAACGTQLPPSNPSAITPNGYRFYGLKSGGIKGLGGDFQFSGSAMIDDRNQIVYGSYSQSSDRVSTRSLEYSLSNQEVTVRGERTIISDGDKITDHEVLRLGSSDLNFQGALALVAEVDTGLRAALMDADGNQLPGHGEVMPFQYLCLEKGNGVEVLVKPYDKTQEGHQFFGMFGDVDIHDDGNIVFVADYQHLLEDGTSDPRHGVFQMRQGQQPRLLLTNNAAAEQTTGAGSVGRYGLVDLHDNGNLVVQAHTNQGTQNSSPVLLQGNMARINPQAPFSGLTLQTSQNVQLQNRMPNLRLGAVSFGPRSGAKGRFAYVLTQNKQQILLQNQKVITQTGASSPLGAMVQGTMPPVLSGQNLTYVVIGTRDGDELAAYDGQRLYTYLKSGDTLYNNPKPIDRIFFGYTAQQANRAGALAFVVSHPDKTASLVLGVPV